MIRILTDSAADFTQEELRRLNIRCVPMTISFGSRSYQDGVDLPTETFWKRIRSGETPKTSQPSPDAFLSEFEDAKACGDSVICILVSTALSGTVQSALIARDMAEYDAIQIIDSLSATAGERLLVLHACKLRDAGETSLQKMADEIHALVPRVRIFACLNTLEYLARGGRIPKAVAGVGMLVKLKPLVTVSREGLVEMAGKSIGRHRAGDALIRLTQECGIDDAYPLLPLYTFDKENCQAFLRQAAQAGLICDEQNAVAIGSTIGTHVGDGAFGLAFISKT